MSATPAPDRKVAFVTGAAYGIGNAIALALARDGFDIAISGTKVENVARTCAEIEPLGVRVCALALDVRSVESVHEAFARVIRALGRVDVLVNNAGVTINKTALELPPSEWDNVVATNLNGAFYMSQAMGRHLVEAGRGGSIISIASTHGIVGFPKRSAYGASKAGIMQLTRMLAIEWAEHGIRVNAVAAGRCNTPGRTDTFADASYMEMARKRIPLGRFCTVEDVAEAVRYLASPAAAYVTGHTLVVDGGVTVA
jgi:NAD(P)-dependent dehydrogenase (short-subunit alcohol dehydrogenase family)